MPLDRRSRRRGGRDELGHTEPAPAALKVIDAERLLDVHEAADLLAVKPATLYQWAYQRRLPVVKLFGPRGALRFRRSDLEALVARSVRPALRENA